MERNIRELIAQMTPEEKASLCLGGEFWHTKAIDRLGDSVGNADRRAFWPAQAVR